MENYFTVTLSVMFNQSKVSNKIWQHSVIPHLTFHLVFSPLSFLFKLFARTDSHWVYNLQVPFCFYLWGIQATSKGMLENHLTFIQFNFAALGIKYFIII